MIGPPLPRTPAPPAAWVPRWAGVALLLIAAVFMLEHAKPLVLPVVVAVMVWGWLWGIAGALIAVPLLLALRTVCKRTRRLALVCNYLEGDWTEPPSLRSLLSAKRRGRGAACGSRPG